MLYLMLITQNLKEKGAGMAEYALLLALVAVALILGFQGLASGISRALSAVVSALPV